MPAISYKFYKVREKREFKIDRIEKKNETFYLY